jgi:hypothetical protein
MNQLNDEEILSFLNQSEFKNLGPFEFLYLSDSSPRRIDTRYGEPCYILKSKKEGICFYVRLNGTIEQEKK